MKSLIAALLLFPFLLAPSSAPTTTTQAIERPIIQLWDGGSYWSGEKPSILFALWEDGRVVRRVGPKLMIGTVARNEVISTMEFAERERFLSLKLTTLVGVDAPEKRLSGSWRGKYAVLRFHEHHIDPQEIGEHASPSREEIMQLVTTWSRVRKQLDDLVPDDLRTVRDDLKLEYPKP